MADSRSFTITWRIKNFSFCWHKDEEELSCPEFNIGGIEGSKWRLFLFPRASRYKKCWSIACYLYHESEKDGPHEVKIDYEFSAIGYNGLPLETITIKECLMQEKDWSSPLLLKQNTVFLEKRDQFLPNDTLTIRCRIWQISQENISPERFFAKTRIEVENASLFGVLKMIDSTSDNENKYSVEFLSTSIETPPIFIQIGFTDGTPHIEIFSENSELKFCKCEMYFTDDSGKEVFKGEDEFLFHFDMIPLYSDTNVWDFPLLPSCKRKHYKYYELHNLAIRCNIAYSTGIISENIENVGYSINTFQNGCHIQEKRPEKLPSLKSDLLTLMHSADYCDIKLQTKNKTFPAHRNILSARSLFFRNKLADKKEKVDIIYVEDLEIEILNQMLLFLYTDTIENLELEKAMKLYIASAEYEIPSLKHRCSSFLQTYLDASVCCDALKAADQYQDGDLKKAAQNYILEHEDEIIGSDKWQELKCLTELIEEFMHLKKMKN